LEVERKKYRELGEDCQAVSEVIGQVLMIAIVVLAFSSIAITIFSDEGVVNPPHIPHTDLSEKINTNTDIVQIIHNGGEAIDLKAIKIILSVNGDPFSFNLSDPGVTFFSSNGSESNNGVLMLGDFIEINTSQRGLDLKNDDTIDMYFVHTPSQQVIQRVTLQNGK
jgi:FlaG/FlaF family flagellin (archaellin)